MFSLTKRRSIPKDVNTLDNKGYAFVEFGGKGDAKKALDQWKLGQEDYPMVILPKRAWLVSKRKNFGFLPFLFFSSFISLSHTILDNYPTSQRIPTARSRHPFPISRLVPSCMSLQLAMVSQETNSEEFLKSLGQWSMLTTLSVSFLRISDFLSQRKHRSVWRSFRKGLNILRRKNFRFPFSLGKKKRTTGRKFVCFVLSWDRIQKNEDKDQIKRRVLSLSHPHLPIPHK